MQMFVFIITTLGLGVLCSIPGILVGRYLAIKGIARAHSKMEVATSIAGMFIVRLMLPDLPLIYIVPFFLFLSPLGAYRADLWTTFRSGKWWWLKKNDERQPLFNLPVSIAISFGIGVVIMITIFGIWILITYFLR